MYEAVEWVRPADLPILSAIAIHDGRWIKPASLSLNVTYSRYTVATRCRTLGAKELLDCHDDVAAYRINDRGLALLDGDLGPEEID